MKVEQITRKNKHIVILRPTRWFEGMIEARWVKQSWANFLWEKQVHANADPDGLPPTGCNASNTFLDIKHLHIAWVADDASLYGGRVSRHPRLFSCV